MVSVCTWFMAPECSAARANDSILFPQSGTDCGLGSLCETAPFFSPVGGYEILAGAWLLWSGETEGGGVLRGFGYIEIAG